MHDFTLLSQTLNSTEIPIVLRHYICKSKYELEFKIFYEKAKNKKKTIFFITLKKHDWHALSCVFHRFLLRWNAANCH